MHERIIIYESLLHVDGNVLATDVVVSGLDPPAVHLEEVINCVGTEGDIDECPREDARECLNIGAGVICPNGEFIAYNRKLLINELEIEEWDQPMSVAIIHCYTILNWDF
jgi:heterodisulfide reductase subunit C